MNYRLVPVTGPKLDHIAMNLRGADLVELVANRGLPLDPSKALNDAVESSQVSHIAETGDGEPFFVFGCGTCSATTKVIWALGTPRCFDFKIPLVRASRRMLASWFESDPKTTAFLNCVHIGNSKHIQWLKALGAELLPPVPRGPSLQEFHPFIIRRASYV